jgi:glycyl-tRNA synthetase beta chain
VAFAADGTLSDVGLKFVESKGLEKDSVRTISTPKGDYLVGKKLISGGETLPLIKKLAEHLVKSIPFSKNMRWGDKEMRFSRPVQYIFSSYNGKSLALDIEDVKMSDSILTHRFMGGKVAVSDFSGYQKALKEGFVIVSSEERREAIVRQLAALADEHGFVVDKDEDLLDTVADLVEYPHAVLGSFDEKFLVLPAPVLITSMKHHQKYFAVYDKTGKLLPKFIGISNMSPEDDSTIRKGYERVLVARLNDALFFYENDKKVALESRVEMLKKVVYQEKLGTSYEKLERMKALAAELAAEYAPTKLELVERAAVLAKADLMCGMVYEFPELQGFMGRIYAGLQRENEEVAAAIEEHYMPRYAGAELPATDTGKILALADKFDTMAGAFAVGLIPSGNVDPYGLRRAAIGIINIAEEAGWRLPLKALVVSALEKVKSKATEDLDESTKRLMAFFITRHKQMLLNQGNVDTDAYDAAAESFTDFITQRDKALALTEAKGSDTFKSIAQSYKRINNILKKAEFSAIPVDSALFEQQEEKDLYALYQAKRQTVESLSADRKWQEAVNELSGFADVLAAWFDKVMVMAPDEKLRNNRLALLTALRALFITVADLSLIQA